MQSGVQNALETVACRGGTMDCTEFLENYSDFLDRRFEERSLKDFREHIKRCSSCARYDRVMQKGLGVLRELAPPRPAPDFLPRLASRIWRLETSDGGGRRLAGSALVTAFASIGLVILTSATVIRARTQAIQLPPVVVEAPRVENAGTTFLNPASTFRPRFDLLRVPDFSEGPQGSWLRRDSQDLSLFRAPLGASTSRTTPTRVTVSE